MTAPKSRKDSEWYLRQAGYALERAVGHLEAHEQLRAADALDRDRFDSALRALTHAAESLFAAYASVHPNLLKEGSRGRQARK